MSVDPEEFLRLKKRADQLKADAQRAAGARDTLLRKLKDEYDCDTIEAAEKLAVKLEKEETAAVASYKAALAKFKEEFGEHLEERT